MPGVNPRRSVEVEAEVAATPLTPPELRPALDDLIMETRQQWVHLNRPRIRAETPLHQFTDTYYSRSAHYNPPPLPVQPTRGPRCNNCKIPDPLWACRTCYMCTNCGCMCRRCRICKAKVPSRRPHFCRHCGVCSKCDTCRRMPHYGKVEVPANLCTFINTLRRPLGIELELSEWGVLKNSRPKTFTYDVAHDWSVQPSGEEMVLRPLAGDNVIMAMFELAYLLYTSNATVNETCALHVHVDGTDLSAWEIRRLLTVYTALEEQIYTKLCAPWRSNVPTVVHYCQMLTRPHRPCERCTRYDSQYPGERAVQEPISELLRRLFEARTTSALKSVLTQHLYHINLHYDADLQGRLREITHHERVNRGRSLESRKGGRYEWCRYVGLNLHAWMYRGTVEWRMKEGVTDLETLLVWPLFCGYFVHAITQMNDAKAWKVTSLPNFAKDYMPAWVAAWVERKCYA